MTGNKVFSRLHPKWGSGFVKGIPAHSGGKNGQKWGKADAKLVAVGKFSISLPLIPKYQK